MKRLAFCCALVGLLAFGGQVSAVTGTIDNVPAATLLLPYFELDLDDPNGVTTLFSINNASATAQLAHVILWTDWSIPVLDFDVYLTGYDVQTFNLRDILVNGILPQTGAGTTTLANDPGSPLGLYSGPDVLFPNCNPTNSPPVPPVYAIPAINATFKAHLHAWLTGKRSPANNTCAGENYGDNIARGYITIDDVNACSLLFAADTGYWISGGLGIGDNDNVLWGDYFYVNPGQNFAQGETLVHIEADAAVFNTPGEYTFYGRYNTNAADNREPLATTFLTRYMTGGGFTGGTDLIVWRDSKFSPGGTCSSGPNYGELSEEQIVVFDEFENPVTVQIGGPSGEPIDEGGCTFCNEAQRIEVGSELLPTEADFGWIYLNLNHYASTDLTLGPGYAGVAQAWVTAVMDADGRFSVGFDAVQLDNANTAASGGLSLPLCPGPAACNPI